MSKDINYLDYLNLVERDGIGIDGVKADLNGLCRDNSYYGEEILRSLEPAEREALADGPAGWPAEGYVLRFPCRIGALRQVLGPYADAICPDTAKDYEEPDTLDDMAVEYIDDGDSQPSAEGGFISNGAQDFPPDVRQRYIEAEYWSERTLSALCLGVHTYADRDDIAPENERKRTREQISKAIQSGELPADPNPDAGTAERMYGGVWRIEPARAVRWALSRFPKFPEWLSRSKLREIYEIQDAEKQAAGRYTLKEAADEISTSGERAKPMLEKLLAAAKSGTLPVYSPGESARYQYTADKHARSYYEEAYWDDLNEWLAKHEARISFKFPAPTRSSDATLAEVVRTKAESSDDWRVKARQIADECFDRDTANKSRDSLAGYSRRVMDEMQKREIHGPRGRIDNPSTIQREALQGAKWWANKKK